MNEFSQGRLSSMADRKGVNSALAYLKSSWWLPVTCGLVASVIGLFLCISQTPVYRGTATLYVTSGNDANSQSAYQGSLASQQRVASYAKLAKSEAVVSSALQSGAYEMSLDDAANAISVSTEPDSVLLGVSVDNPDPQIAAQFSNAVADSLARYVATLEVPSSGGYPLAKVTVVTPATSSDVPVSPVKSTYILGGFAIGLMIGLVIVVVRSRFDHRVRVAADVELATTVPVLATVPIDDSLTDSTQLERFKSGASAAIEGFRRLRSSVNFVSVDAPVRSILVTSGSSGEGKTTTSINLAASLAESGKKVILVDGDLRSPSLAPLLGLAEDIGITSWLSGAIGLEDAIQASGVKGLDVLASGPLAPSPSELLGSARMASTFATLLESYDYVIMDSAPILPVADSLLVSGAVDGVLLVVRSMRTKLGELSESMSQLHLSGANVIGVVVNRVPGALGSYGYGYGYYGYGAGRSGSGFTEAVPPSSSEAVRDYAQTRSRGVRKETESVSFVRK